MLIAILNQSTLVSDADAATMTQAVAAQVRLDAAPLWDRIPAAVVFYTDPAAVPALCGRPPEQGRSGALHACSLAGIARGFRIVCALSAKVQLHWR